MAEESFLRSEAGTPQGGILSPLLANIVLSAIEQRHERFIAPRRTRDGAVYARPGDAIRIFRHKERKAGRPVFLPVRYADDFVVHGRSDPMLTHQAEPQVRRSAR